MSKTTTNLVLSISFPGSDTYDGSEWREAILAFLNKVWSGDKLLTLPNQQRIAINKTTIQLGRVFQRYGDREYFAYYVSEPDDTPLPHTLLSDQSAYKIRGCEQNVIEIGLVRFVRDNKMRELWLQFRTGMIVLTKGQARSELFISTRDIPNMENAKKYAGE